MIFVINFNCLVCFYKLFSYVCRSCKLIKRFIISGCNFSGKELTTTKSDLSKLNEALRLVLNDNKQTNSSLLQDYCPWLANFTGYRHDEEIEIPGQYDGKKLPLPQHHAKIAGFSSNVCIFIFHFNFRNSLNF